MKFGKGTVSWKSMKQTSVAASTAEAEYYSLLNACSEAKWILSLLNEIQVGTKFCKLYCDNTACIAIAQNPKQHKRTKFIDIKYHKIREFVNDATK